MHLNFLLLKVHGENMNTKRGCVFEVVVTFGAFEYI